VALLPAPVKTFDRNLRTPEFAEASELSMPRLGALNAEASELSLCRGKHGTAVLYSGPLCRNPSSLLFSAFQFHTVSTLEPVVAGLCV
jgi:hypothetical protein